MPELPEVESNRRLLSKIIVGKEIKLVLPEETGGGPRDGLFDNIVLEPQSMRSSSLVKQELEGATCVSLQRRGKQMWWNLTRKGRPSIALLFHFGMTGALVVKGVGSNLYKNFKVDRSTWPPKFTKMQAHFSDGTEVAFVDPRRLGRIRIREDPLNSPPISLLAPDALEELPSPEDFTKALTKYSAPIKAVLLDQNKIVAGVGNYIVDECLYQSRIHPEASSKVVGASKPDAFLLREKLLEVCRVASDCNSNLEDFPSHWLFHNKWKRKGVSNQMNGKSIKYSTVGGRTTAHVPGHQRKTFGVEGEEHIEVEIKEETKSEESDSSDAHIATGGTKPKKRTPIRRKVDAGLEVKPEVATEQTQARKGKRSRTSQVVSAKEEGTGRRRLPRLAKKA